MEIIAIVIKLTTIKDIWVDALHVVMYILVIIWFYIFLRKWHKETFYDELTGVENRFAYETVLSDLKNKNLCLGAIFIDIDNLKRVNDTRGHAAGDELIKKISALLKSTIDDYKGDLFRIGGDEFVGIIKNIDKTKIDAIKADINNKIKELNKGARDRFSISIGAAIKKPNENFEMTIQRADDAMYSDKKAKKLRA